MNGAESAAAPGLARVERDWWRRRPPLVETATAAVDEAGGHGLPFWGFVTFTAILLLAPQQTIFPFLAPLHIAMLSVLVAGALHVASWMRGRAPLVQRGPEVVLTVLLLLWAVVTVPFSMWPGGSVNMITGTFIKALIVFWLLGAIVVGARRFRSLLWCLSLIAIPLAVTAIKHFANGTTALAGRIVGYDAPLANNPNDLALLLNIILPLTAALAVVEERTSRRLLLYGVMLLDAGAIVATFSRAGFLSLALTGLLCLWRFRSRLDFRWIAAAGLAGLLALPLVPGRYYARLSTILNKNTDPTGSAQQRWADMGTATRYIVGHPVIGAGIGQDVLAMNQARGAKWIHVHDVYLEYAMDLGLPGLLLFLLLLASCFRGVGRVRGAPPRSGVPPHLRWLAEGLWISLATFAVSAAFYPDAYEFYFYYLAGLAVAMQATVRAHRPAGGRQRAAPPGR